ncbi:hypothetical protein PBI_COUNT_28 [Microbacterium phage Count]|nr:hypothetical protein PBI_COUNT_28 [Microbacterium phage Count]
MVVPDITSLTLEELKELISIVATQISVLESQKANDKSEARNEIVNARAQLEGLLGPVDAAPSTESIRGVLAFGDEVISQNASTAVPLIVHGMASLTEVLINLTKTMDSN